MFPQLLSLDFVFHIVAIVLFGIATVEYVLTYHIEKTSDDRPLFIRLILISIAIFFMWRVFDYFSAVRMPVEIALWYLLALLSCVPLLRLHASLTKTPTVSPVRYLYVYIGALAFSIIVRFIYMANWQQEITSWVLAGGYFVLLSSYLMYVLLTLANMRHIKSSIHQHFEHPFRFQAFALGGVILATLVCVAIHTLIASPLPLA